MILVRVKPAIYLPALMFTWGGISMCLAACNSYQTLACVRFFLGVVEAGFAPGILFLLSSWYRKNELATRFALYYTASAFSGALGGLLAGAITGNLDGKGGIAGWRYLFLVSLFPIPVKTMANFRFGYRSKARQPFCPQVVLTLSSPTSPPLPPG
jgi:MFS family permease